VDKTIGILLEYCGGTRTDRLVANLRNTLSLPVYVLDNASQKNCCSCATHRNKSNSGVGGGVSDAFRLAESMKAKIILFCTNDVEIVDPSDIPELVDYIESDGEVVQIGASITPESQNAQLYPWMVKHENSSVRKVIHCDLLLCAVRIDFIKSYGWFPSSRGGYGYDWELAYHVDRNKKKILVHDRVTVKHHATLPDEEAAQSHFAREQEQYRVYGLRYGRPNLDADCVSQFASHAIRGNCILG
jgi:glycosyltransferase involved in cell wall biosynthesis